MHLEVPLTSEPDTDLSDANKRLFLERSLRHQLVDTIRQQAAAFKSGLEEVLGPSEPLSLLTADELRGLWAGDAIDDEKLEVWKSWTTLGRPVAWRAAELFWLWLRTESPSTRSKVLQFATGSRSLPHGLTRRTPPPDAPSSRPIWQFIVDQQDSPATVQPTASNGLTEPAMLAQSSTCALTIYLPAYADVEALKRGMQFSLLDGGFGQM